MRKRIWILLAAALLLLLPHVASANSPARNPWEITVWIENVPENTTVAGYFAGEDGAFAPSEIGEWRANGARQKMYFIFREGDTQFCLVCTAPDGTETRSNTVGVSEYGKYSYDGAANRLEENGATAVTMERCESVSRTADCALGCGKVILLYGLVLAAAFAVTLLVEWLTALCFRLRPVKYVLAINAITNPAMNLLLLISTALIFYSRIAYWILLAVLEIAVVFIEYAFYVKKYPETRRSRLLLFSITANVLSLALGGLLQYLIL